MPVVTGTAKGLNNGNDDDVRIIANRSQAVS
jgi:hypothetical protein